VALNSFTQNRFITKSSDRVLEAFNGYRLQEVHTTK